MKKIRPKVTGATALATTRTDCCLLCGASNNPAYLRRHSSPKLNLRRGDLFTVKLGRTSLVLCRTCLVELLSESKEALQGRMESPLYAIVPDMSAGLTVRECTYLRYRDDAMELTAVDGPGQRTCYTFDKSAVGTYIFSCKEDADEALAKLRNGRNPAASESEVAK